MNKYLKYLRWGILGVMATSLFIAMGAEASAHSRMQKRVNKLVQRAENQVEKMLNNYCNKFEMWQQKYDSEIPKFCAWIEAGEITPTPMPSASPVPTVLPSATPTIMPSMTPMPTPTVMPSATPVPVDGALVISEVYYDVDEGHGAEATNEWIELYNGTNSGIDLSGYVISDGNSADVIGDGVSLGSGEYLWVVANITTYDLWDEPVGVNMISLDSSVGNGLGNTGDVVTLSDGDSLVIDSVSWGNNITAFDPGAVDVSEGNSLVRDDVMVDTDTAGDWGELDSPSPGG